MSTKEERHICKQKTVTSRHCVNCEGQRKLGRERQKEGERKEEGRDQDLAEDPFY